MAIPKKGLRKISVGNSTYGWNASGNDGWINLSIGLLDHSGQLLTASFGYHHNAIENFNKDGTVKSWSIKQRFVITSGIVKQVIEYGLLKGWRPQEKGSQFNLGYLDEMIDLKLKSKITYPDLSKEQVTLNFADLKSGETLNTRKAEYTEGDDIYLVVDSLMKAKELAVEAIASDQRIECWIKTGKETPIYYISINEEKEFNN
jgi:hypothetical protein